MKFKQRQTIHLSMEKDDVLLMSQMKHEHGLNSFAEVQAWLLDEYRAGRITQQANSNDQTADAANVY